MTRGEIFTDVVDIACFWEKLGVLYGSIEVPWVPTPREIIEFIMEMISIGYGDVFYDLGCGDGRIVIEVAKRGARAVCIEIDSKLIRIAEEQAKRLNLDKNIIFLNSDIINVKLMDASIVYMYLTSSFIDKIKNKLLTELRPGTLVISLDYNITGLTPIAMTKLQVGERMYSLWFYIIN